MVYCIEWKQGLIESSPELGQIVKTELQKFVVKGCNSGCLPMMSMLYDQNFWGVSIFIK